MRALVIAFGLASLLGLAGSAHAERIEDLFPPNTPHRGACIRLTKQIVRYAGDVEMARARDNELWENATLGQIQRLTDRRRELCPQIAAQEDPAWRRLGQLLGVAAQIAIKYFTYGTF